jgi:hypothetical protein
MAINPTVSRVTPVANSGNRRAARPAGYGRRYPAQHNDYDD